MKLHPIDATRSVITRLTGGLGNQMFQYASGVALARRLGLPLMVDARECWSHNGYELPHVFAVDPPQADGPAVRALLGWRGRRKVQRTIKLVRSHIVQGRCAFEPHFHHWPGFDRISGPCYLDGYWQSPWYFSAVDAELRDRHFAFRQPLVGRNAELAGIIEGTDHPTSVHVRRGDYVADRKVAAIHGALDVSYYRRGVKHLRDMIGGDLRCFVFSDDPRWVREHLDLPTSTVFIDHNTGRESHFDLQLMARCQHHVIANSSFSWWGAWLNRSPAKIVVAPDRWFARTKHDTSTLLPTSWIRL